MALPASPTRPPLPPGLGAGARVRWGLFRVGLGGVLPHCTRAVALKPFVPPRLTPPRQLSPGGAPADTYPIKPHACVLHSSQLRPCRPLYYLSRLPRIVSAADPPGPPAPLRSPRAGPGLDFARSAGGAEKSFFSHFRFDFTRIAFPGGDGCPQVDLPGNKCLGAIPG